VSTPNDSTNGDSTSEPEQQSSDPTAAAPWNSGPEPFGGSVGSAAPPPYPPPGAPFPPPAGGETQQLPQPGLPNQPFPPAPPPPGYGSVGPSYPPAGYPPPGYGGAPGFAGPDPTAPWGRHPITGEPYSEKQKIVAGLLQIFLGTFGAGRFYLGYTGIAVAQLLTCGGLGIWALIDGILILTGKVRDPQGRPLRD
jgi:TM2 domain-containing membrane protein YozV